jgi:formylglycine-generating enzyme required for sulfatase activity
MMGSDHGDDDEIPMSEQCFEEPFWIDKFEVTNVQFANFNNKLLTQSEYK